MKRSDFNRIICRILFFSATTLFIGIIIIPGFTNAEKKPLETNQDEMINITANSLTFDNEAKYAEFIGNVKATQGDSVINADKLKIFYKKGLDDKNKQTTGEESIEKIVATGNVKIRLEDRVAVSEEAVYTMETRILVLTGDGSKITSGNDSISGAKITLYRTDGRITIESNKETRVKAVLYPGKKGLN